MALTVLEVALNRFPFPSEGEAPLQSPIELLTYLISMGVPKVEDEPKVGIKYTNAFRNFIQVWCVCRRDRLRRTEADLRSTLSPRLRSLRNSATSFPTITAWTRTPPLDLHLKSSFRTVGSGGAPSESHLPTWRDGSEICSDL